MEKLYSTKEAANFLGVSVITLKRYRKSGKLKPVSTSINGYSEYSHEQLVSFQKVVSTGISEPVSTSITSINQTSITDTTLTKVVSTSISEPVSTSITRINQTSITDTTDTGFNSPDTTLNPYQGESDTSITSQNSYQPVSPPLDTTLDKPVSIINDKKNSALSDGGGYQKNSFIKNHVHYSKYTTHFAIPDSVIDEIKQIPPEVLESHLVISVAKAVINGKPTYICPYCDNGTGKDGTGIQPNFIGNAWIYHCFKCNETFNNIHLLAFHYNLDYHSDFQEICRRACNDFGIYLESNNTFNYPSNFQTDEKINGGQGRWTSTKKIDKVDELGGCPPFKTPEELELESKEIEMIQADIAVARTNLKNLPLDARRGLTLETYEFFEAGFIPDWTSPTSRINNKYSTPTPRLIIPSGNHYLARLTVPLETFDENTQQFIHPKQHAGSKFPFNFKSISTDKINIVVEGELDAMSIWQATNGKIPVIATSGATGYIEFVRLVKEKFANTKDKPTFLILFDSDEAGRTNALKFTEALNSAQFLAVCDFLSSEVSKIDANDILCQQGENKLAELINSIFIKAQNNIAEIVLKINEETKFKEKLAQWSEINGDISPEAFSKLKIDIEYLKSFAVNDITSAIINDSRTLYAIASCQFYDFYRQIADDFMARIHSAKSSAKKTLQAETTDNPVSDSVRAVALLDLKAIIDSIKKFVTQIAKSHKSYIEHKKAEQELIEHEEKILAAEKYRTDAIKHLEYLKLQAPTSERDNEMRQVISSSCTWHEDKYGNKVSVLSIMANYDLIFKYDPTLDGLFAYDEFKQAYVFLKSAPWRKTFFLHETWQDSDDANLRIYLRRNYTDISNENLCADTFQAYSWERSFHVVKDYLNNLPKWDGIPRAETLFIKFLRVDDTNYSREITMNWLFGALARIFYPGCEYQTALVLNGAQKIGKSTIAKLLGGQWHAALKDSVEDSHAIDVLQTAWIVELEEFWAAGKAAVNALKAFISANADDRREVYARKAKKFLRHCVFIVTCNDQQFLKDKTGNRRFMVLKCNSKKFQYVDGLTTEYIQQVWAETLQKFNEKFADGFNDSELQLSVETQHQAEEIAETFTIDDSLDGEIEAFLNTKIPPYVIWKLLTKEERRKFFLSNSITLDEGDWQSRKQFLKPDDVLDFDSALNNDKFTRKIEKNTPYGYASCIVVYGSVYRSETCTSEIFNECFGNDKRKTMFRINEVLSSLEDWILSENRTKDFHDCYGDQRRIYCRRDNSEQNDIFGTNVNQDFDLLF